MEILTGGDFKTGSEQYAEMQNRDLRVSALYAQDAEYYETLFAEPEKFNLLRAWQQWQKTTRTVRESLKKINSQS